MIIMAQLICERNSVGYNLRSQGYFSLQRVKSVYYDLKALRYFGSKICIIVPCDIKNSRAVQEFMKKLNHGFLETILLEHMKNTCI